MENPALADDLQREYDALADRRSFGLNFERHVPEAVELPGRKVRKGDKVRILPPRDETRTAANDRLWQVTGIRSEDGIRRAAVASLDDTGEEASAAVDDLVVVAEFRDPIYPGLVSTGKIECGGNKPFHTVINAENFHALQTLLFTHRGKVDCIYIDPPYNTGNEWAYNDKYVAGNDIYRHSKWLAFIERRLILARDLLSPSGVLCVSIGSDEVHRLKLLVEQTIPELTVQVITVQVTAGGKSTAGINTLNEYVVCATTDEFVPSPTSFTGGVERSPWEGLVLATFNRSQRPNQCYPIFIAVDTGAIHSVGASLTAQQRNRSFLGSPEEFKFEVTAPAGTVPIWPITTKGEECVWRLAPDRLISDWGRGYIKVSPNRRQGERNQFSVQYLPAGVIKKVESGEIPKLGVEPGVPTLVLGANMTAGAAIPSIWAESSHRTSVGNDHLKSVFGDKRFPYPKPVPLLADIVLGFTHLGESAVVLDFFAGSGSTVEAVMTANRSDGGNRQAILITNNEVSAEESSRLVRKGLRRGDDAWEARGVFEHVARPRVMATTTGLRADGTHFSDGFEENVEFFTLTYEAPLRIASNREFAKVAPLLWMRAGSQGRRIDDISLGWDVADVYGVIADLDRTEPFLKAIAEKVDIAMAFIVTDEDKLFEALVAALPDRVEPVRLYEAYLRNFEIEAGRAAR